MQPLAQHCWFVVRAATETPLLLLSSADTNGEVRAPVAGGAHPNLVEPVVYNARVEGLARRFFRVIRRPRAFSRPGVDRLLVGTSTAFAAVLSLCACE